MPCQYERTSATVAGHVVHYAAREVYSKMSERPYDVLADTGDPEAMHMLASARMPFGKYKGWLLIDLPELYVVWFARQGFPPGRLGYMLQALYEVKVNGLEYLFRPRGDARGDAA